MNETSTRGRKWGFVAAVCLAAMIGGAMSANVARWFSQPAPEDGSPQDGFLRRCRHTPRRPIRSRA